MEIQRLNWAGLRLVHGDTTLFVDAIQEVSGWSGPGMDEATLKKQLVPLAADTPQRHALITHHHGDHADPDALRPFFRDDSRLVCARDVADRLAWRGRPPLTTHVVSLHEPVFLSPWEATFVAFPVPAVDGLGDPQVSWVIEAGGRRIFHGGDTIWHGHFPFIGRAYGPFDAAFLPVNGVLFRRGFFRDNLEPATLTPEQAAMAAHLLGAHTLVPIHFKMFRNDTDYLETPDVEKRLLAAGKSHGVEVRIVEPGGAL